MFRAGERLVESLGHDAREMPRALLAQFEPSQSGVHALFQDGSSAELARSVIELLVAHARALAD